MPDLTVPGDRGLRPSPRRHRRPGRPAGVLCRLPTDADDRRGRPGGILTPLRAGSPAHGGCRRDRPGRDGVAGRVPSSPRAPWRGPGTGAKARHPGHDRAPGRGRPRSPHARHIAVTGIDEPPMAEQIEVRTIHRDVRRQGWPPFHVKRPGRPRPYGSRRASTRWTTGALAEVVRDAPRRCRGYGTTGAYSAGQPTMEAVQ